MSNVHLLVLVHGMWGHPRHLAELNRIISETTAGADSEVVTMVAETNKDDSTYDGIDWGGERVAEEIEAQVKELEASGKTVDKFSITGYSLGGLISRYVVGILRQRGFFEKVSPLNFNTIATPHLGLPKYHPVFSTLASTLGPKLLSRTGEQFYCVDKWGKTEKSLLEVMSEPGQIFYQALAAFQNIQIYANAVSDNTVPYLTASISLEDPFADHKHNGIEIELNEKYKHIIEGYTLPDIPPPREPPPRRLSRAWFKKQSSRQVLPPFLQYRFPGNVIIYLSIPVLLPLFLTLAIVRLSLSSRSSRARIKLIEKEATSKGTSLLHIVSQLERQVEGVVAEMIDDPELGPSPSSSQLPAPDSPLETFSTDTVESKAVKAKHTILSATQIKMAKSLNTLPIKKHAAWFPNVMNSHAIIVSRDVKTFAFHREGEGVIRHWADSFVL